jgi:branched-chain amino acid transport system permease protein
MGINTLVYKSLAFAFSVFFTGAAGSIYAYYQAFVFPDGAFNFLIDVRMIIVALVGGRGTLFGPLLGAATIVPMTEFFNTFLGSTELNAVALGALLVIIIKFKPSGILGGKPIRLGHLSLPGVRRLSKAKSER